MKNMGKSLLSVLPVFSFHDFVFLQVLWLRSRGLVAICNYVKPVQKSSIWIAVLDGFGFQSEIWNLESGISAAMRLWGKIGSCIL